MRKGRVFVHGVLAGLLEEIDGKKFRFQYESGYAGEAVSLTMPVKNREYEFDEFPAFFEGLLPEGIQLDALLRKCKLDKSDYFGQLLQVGHDTVGAVTVESVP